MYQSFINYESNVGAVTRMVKAERQDHMVKYDENTNDITELHYLCKEKTLA